MKNVYNQAYEELQLILDVSFDGITIADGEGVFRRMSKSFADLVGVKESEIVGESAFLLEKKGIFDTSVTCEVIRKNKRVTIVQKTAANRIVLVTGIPIYNEKNKIEKIINISKDITETKKLESNLKNLQTELEWFKQELNKRTSLDQNKVAFKSKTMEKIINLVYHVANMDVTVLLLGETGVGKGFMAKMIHSSSNRKDLPFLTINCGAIPENLFESELFGYEKGSFTGASKEGKRGLFEMAGNGTVFLDEIGDMPLSLQVKLLNVLDDKIARRIGGSKSYIVNARVIFATNKNLKELVNAGKFREDLFYRLNIVPITIPALRQRKEDLLFLINLFLDNKNKKYGMKKVFSEEALKALYEYEFPGNIRELENLVERLVINTVGETIEGRKIYDTIDPETVDTEQQLPPLKVAVEELERKLLLSAFQKYKTTRKVADVLKIDQSTVVKKAKKLNISGEY
ncbi:sigma-54 interaction domain-containing protein [Peribacillus butanolivorans]|uniref:sigma-54 interaction domain-containing protein n=1 Tax=Peribacillus butanolivorans TaxID=421767 RepID=UPI00381EE650